MTIKQLIFTTFNKAIKVDDLALPFSIILLVIALVNIALAIYALRFAKSPGTLAYSFIMTFLGLYSFAYAFELLSSDLQQIIFWLKIEYIGISFLPALFIVLAAQYTGLDRLLKPWLIVPLFFISFSTLLFQHTNYGNLFYQEYKFSTSAPFLLADFEKGTWYWVHQAYANLMILISSILYLLMFRKTSGHNRKRALIMLLALDIPWCFYAVYLIGGSPYHIDLCPFSFSVAGILTALGIFRYKLLDYIPLALENVFNSMTTGILTLDEDKCLVNFNPSAKEILPELSENLTGKPVDPIFPILPCLSNLQDGFETDIEISHHGTVMYFHLKMVAVKTRGDRLIGWAIIFSNITERKLKEIELLNIEKYLKELNISKDKFFAIIAHDLRNAFHLIINMSDMIIENLNKDDKAAALRKGHIIYDTSVNTNNLLQNLLDWALMQLKGITFNPRDLLLANLVEYEIKNLKTQSAQKKLKVLSSINELLMVHGDEEMLKTVIRNLMSNAIKYSNPGGAVHIIASEQQGMVRVEVSDNGVGMSREDKDKLFRIESYFTKKGTASENGTGLGLKLCKEFIQKHNGEIWVTSTLGKGSTFLFTVPKGSGK